MQRILCFFVLLLVTCGAWSATPQALSIEEHNNLVYWRVCLDNAADFKEKGIVASTEAYQSAVGTCVAGAKAKLGRDITFNEIMQSVKTTSELTTSQKVAGWVTGFTWVQGLSAVGIAIFGSIFLFYAFPLFAGLPKGFYEAMLYVGAVGLTWYGLGIGANAYLFGLMGVLLFVGALFFSIRMHKIDADPAIVFGIIMLYAGVATVLYQSTLIGYVAVLALLCAAGFAAEAMGMGYVIGFKDEKSVPIGTTVAFVILGAYLSMRVHNVDQPTVQLFAPGAYGLGSFVGFIGLLIMSSKWYRDANSYLVTNVIMIPLGIGAILWGSAYGIPELSRIGGTFLVLWVIEKYVELTMHGLLSASFFGLIGSIGLYQLAGWALANSDKVGPYLLFIS